MTCVQSGAIGKAIGSIFRDNDKESYHLSPSDLSIACYLSCRGFLLLPVPAFRLLPPLPPIAFPRSISSLLSRNSPPRTLPTAPPSPRILLGSLPPLRSLSRSRLVVASRPSPRLAPPATFVRTAPAAVLGAKPAAASRLRARAKLAAAWPARSVRGALPGKGVWPLSGLAGPPCSASESFNRVDKSAPGFDEDAGAVSGLIKVARWLSRVERCLY